MLSPTVTANWQPRCRHTSVIAFATANCGGSPVPKSPNAMNRIGSLVGKPVGWAPAVEHAAAHARARVRRIVRMRASLAVGAMPRRATIVAYVAILHG